MSHRRKKLEERIARRNRNTSVGIGILGILFGVGGLFKAATDFRMGNLTTGTAAASQQPYGPFLRLVCFFFMIVVGFWFIHHAVQPPPGAGGPPDE
jgi:hypothetical protein